MKAKMNFKIKIKMATVNTPIMARTFTSVKELHISSEFMQSIMLSLQELIGERLTEVLPALQSLFLEEPLPSAVEEAIVQFVAVRQLFGHPIATSYLGATNKSYLESYEADKEKDESSHETDEEMDESSYETDGDPS
jgi:hypothetical protein